MHVSKEVLKNRGMTISFLEFLWFARYLVVMRWRRYWGVAQERFGIGFNALKIMVLPDWRQENGPDVLRGLLGKMPKQAGKDIRHPPLEFGHSQNLWDRKLPSYHLETHYGIHVGVRQCQRIFHKLVFLGRGLQEISPSTRNLLPGLHVKTSAD